MVCPALLGTHCSKIPLLNDWFGIWLPSPTRCLFPLVPGVFDLDLFEVLLEFFAGLDSCYSSTSSKISESFVSIFHDSTKCFNLPASDNFGTSLAENLE